MKNALPKKETDNFQILDSLVYKAKDEWIRLPYWARFYIELGSAISEYNVEQKRFIMALSVPTRSFAPPLITFGLIFHRIGLLEQENEHHITRLQSLGEGSPVIFRTGHRQFKGMYQGIINSCGKKYFLIRDSKSSERAIPFESANKIEILCNKEVRIPKVQSGRELPPQSPFLQRLLDKRALNKITTESQTDYILLGQLNTLRMEICDFPMGIRIDTGNIAEGRIQDLVRAKGGQFQSDNLPYRTLVLPSSGKYSAQNYSNFATLFDSGLGFIKWRSNFKKSNWIVILDKMDRNFEPALKEVNEEYIQNRIDQQSGKSFPNPPAGIEFMFFEVKK